jgi:hypothetical protein
VFASSFRRGDDSEDTGMQGALAPTLAKDDLVKTALAKGSAGKFIEISAGGKRYLVSAVRLPRLSLEKLPADYPEQTAGALVLTDASRTASEYGGATRLILVLGAVALLLAVGGIFLSTQRILHQVDEVELGVAEIINGNVPGVSLTDHGKLIATYALCGFANFSSIAIQIGGIGGLAPERRADLARFGLRAVLGGTIATLMTATIAGVLSQFG